MPRATSAGGAGHAQTIDHPLLRSVLSSPGQPLDAATRAFMEPRFGRDFSGVRVHTGSKAAESARAVNARAYTVGRDVVFGAGQYAPGTDAGKRLMAHELVHTAQQGGAAGRSLAGRTASAVTPQAPAVARAPGDAASTAQEKQAYRAPPYMGFKPDLGDVATQQVESMNTVGVVDVPVTSLYDRKPPHTPVATVTKGTTLTVKGLIRPSDPGKQPVYLVHYHGPMERKESAQIEVLVELCSLAVSSQGPAQAQPSAVQKANDWMAVVPDRGKKGDPEALKPVLASIRDARAAIDERRLFRILPEPPNKPREGYTTALKEDEKTRKASKAKEDEKTRAYEAWLRRKDTHPRLASGPDDIRWKVLRRFFGAEGRPSDMMTYDYTSITWGPGFAGMGSSGITEQAMARLFNQSQEAKDAFWKIGITVDGVDLVMVNIRDADKGVGEKLHGTTAENVLRLDKKLVSFFVNISQGFTGPGQKDPNESLRQKVLDAHFETFLNTTLRNSEGIIERMDEMAAAVAAHAVHTGNHGWGQFLGATTLSEVEARITTQITNLNARKARGEKVGYVYTLEHIKRNLGDDFIDD